VKNRLIHQGGVVGSPSHCLLYNSWEISYKGFNLDARNWNRTWSWPHQLLHPNVHPYKNIHSHSYKNVWKEDFVPKLSKWKVLSQIIWHNGTAKRHGWIKSLLLFHFSCIKWSSVYLSIRKKTGPYDYLTLDCLGNFAAVSFRIKICNVMCIWKQMFL
jgi:hypothetical protein